MTGLVDTYGVYFRNLQKSASILGSQFDNLFDIIIKFNIVNGYVSRIALINSVLHYVPNATVQKKII